LSGSSPLVSPNRPTYPKPSPLARVTEETALPELTIPNGNPREKLVEVDTPRPSGEDAVTLTPRLIALTNGVSGTAAKEPVATNGLSAKANGKQPATAEEAMKTIEI